MLLGACAGQAARTRARCAGQLAPSTNRPSTSRRTARRLSGPGSAHTKRRRATGVATCSASAAVQSDPRERLPPEGHRDKEQRLAGEVAQAKQWRLLMTQAEAASVAAASPKVAKAAADKMLQRWVAAAAGTGGEGAEQLDCLLAEADAIVESLARDLSDDSALDDTALSQGWDSLLALQSSWAAAFPTSSATGLAVELMTAMLDSLVLDRARKAGQLAAHQAQQSAEGVEALQAWTTAGGTTALLCAEAQLRLDSEVTCVEWAYASAARERAWADERCTALETEAMRWYATASAALGQGRDREAAEAVACAHACKTAAQRLTAASMALACARSSLADSQAKLQLMAAQARMASGLSDLARLRVTITAVLASIAQEGPLVGCSGTVAPNLRLRMWHVAAAAAAGAVVLQELKDAVKSGQGGPEGAAHLAAAQAKAAAAVEVLGQLAACLAASTGMEWVAEED